MPFLGHHSYQCNDMKIFENASSAVAMAIRHSYQCMDIKISEIATTTIAIVMHR
jgi:hypothetical protein